MTFPWVLWNMNCGQSSVSAAALCVVWDTYPSTSPHKQSRVTSWPFVLIKPENWRWYTLISQSQALASTVNKSQAFVKFWTILGISPWKHYEASIPIYDCFEKCRRLMLIAIDGFCGGLSCTKLVCDTLREKVIGSNRQRVQVLELSSGAETMTRLVKSTKNCPGLVTFQVLGIVVTRYDFRTVQTGFSCHRVNVVISWNSKTQLNFLNKSWQTIPGWVGFSCRALTKVIRPTSQTLRNLLKASSFLGIMLPHEGPREMSLAWEITVSLERKRGNQCCTGLQKGIDFELVDEIRWNLLGCIFHQPTFFCNHWLLRGTWGEEPEILVETGKFETGKPWLKAIDHSQCSRLDVTLALKLSAYRFHPSLVLQPGFSDADAMQASDALWRHQNT